MKITERFLLWTAKMCIMIGRTLYYIFIIYYAYRF